VKSKRTKKLHPFDDDRSLWGQPFRPEELRGLAEDVERQNAIARRLRLALPLEKRMNVLVLPWLGSRRRLRIQHSRLARLNRRSGSL
jgi:hypothetical protein